MTPLLTVADVAKMLKISPEWVRSHASRRRRPYLPAIILQGEVKPTYRFSREEIEAWLKDLTAKTNGQPRN
jgi:hypothetical protein